MLCMAVSRSASVLLAVLAGLQGDDGIPAGQVDAALLVDVGDLDHDGVAHSHHIFHPLDPLGVQLGDVHKALFARGDLHKGAEVHQAGDLALVDGADLGIFHDGLDGEDGPLGVLLVDGRDKDVAVLLHVDLAVAVGADLLDDLAALADDVLDLVGGDDDAEHLGRPAAQLVARLGDDRLDDLVQDIQAALAALFKGVGNDVIGQAVDLDVHLDGGDALAGAAHLEVHVAVEILHALDVQHGHPAVALGDQAAADAGHRRLDGHARIHQGQSGAADGSLGGGAVGAEHLGHAADGVGEVLHRGQHRHQGALGQGAVADLTPAGAAGRTGLAHRIGREVVVVDIPLGLLVGQIVHGLAVLGAAQGTGGQHLGLAAGEHTRTVDPGQDAHFGGQGPDLVDAAAVHPLALVQQPPADDLLLHLVADQVQVGVGQVGVFPGDVVQDGQQRGVPDVLVVGVHGGLEAVQVLVADGVEDIHVDARGLELHFGLAPLGHDVVDEGDDLLDLHMGVLDGLEHGVLVHLVGAGLDHDDLVHGAGHGQGQVADAALLIGGVDDDLAVHQAHLDAADGAVPGDLGHSRHQRRADHAGDLGAAVGVQAHDGHGDAHIVAHLLGEQGAHGAVHHAAGQDGPLAGTALAAHKAAGDAAGGVQLFLILHAQGEEVDALPGLGAHGDVAQHHRLAVADQGAGVGQPAHLAHFCLEGAACQFHLVDLVMGEGLFAGAEFDCHLLPPNLPGRAAPVYPIRPSAAGYSNKPSAQSRFRRSVYCCNTQRRPCFQCQATLVSK